MNFLIILLAFFVALVIARIPFVWVYNSEGKVHKGFEQILLSFGILGLFIVIWSAIVSKYLTEKQVNDNLILYCVLAFLGIAAIIWCYFRWDLKWKAKPELEEENVLALKKTFVFVLIMLFAFYHGYKQMDAIFNGVEVDSTLTVYNVTMISGIIALDRVLNQVTFIYKKWKKTVKSND